MSGDGTLAVAGQSSRIVTGADSDAAAHALHAFGQPLRGWRSEDGRALFVGQPELFGASASGVLHRLRNEVATRLVREVRASALLFGYRGSERVDVGRLEEMIQRLAQLKDNLPEVQRLELGLVLVGAESLSVLRASGRVAPVADARSDWYTRRLTGPSGLEDTLTG